MMKKEYINFFPILVIGTLLRLENLLRRRFGFMPHFGK